MPVFRAGFSERVFEFSFNAEYAHQNRAVLAAAPYIPTQNEEKWLGYDVEFLLKQRGAVSSLAMQHKVCRYVDAKAGSNAAFWEAAGGAYFAFRIDNDQYNLIHAAAVAGLPGVNFYYCAPLFSRRSDMDGHYVRQTVMANSIWIDVAGANPIIDNEVHTIVCRQDGARAFLFSKDAVELGVQDPTARKKYIEDRVPMHLKDLRKMYVSAFNIVEEYWPSRRSQRRTLDGETYRIPQLPPAKRATDTFEQTVSAARELLAEYYGVSWLVEVHKDTPAVETAG